MPPWEAQLEVITAELLELREMISSSAKEQFYMAEWFRCCMCTGSGAACALVQVPRVVPIVPWWHRHSHTPTCALSP